MSASRIEEMSGRAIPLRGDDIDTDRIIPARFLTAITFDGLEDHLFEDDRRATPNHPFDAPQYQGASVLVVNSNFGCGSSREHAPQAIARWGIRAVIGKSFSEIFFGNSVALGMPCLVAESGDVDRLIALIEADPTAEVAVSVRDLTAVVGSERMKLKLPAPAQQAFLSGSWDATGLLLDDYGDVEAVAAALPYLSSFTSPRNASAAWDISPDRR